jgi:ABC-type nitrate/sulfonate/bicarbonate transport system substrate-binding protein
MTKPTLETIAELTRALAESQAEVERLRDTARGVSLPDSGDAPRAEPPKYDDAKSHSTWQPDRPPNKDFDI